MAKKILVFETHVGEGGHHLEYLNHLYLKATGVSDSSFVFVVPKQFENTKVKFDWPRSSNIAFDYIDDNIVSELRQQSGIKYCYKISKLASYYFHKHNANEIFLISLINFVLFLPFMLSRHASISGILYYIYLYDWQKLNWVKRFEQILMFKLMTKKQNFSKLFLLNDSSAVAYLNKLYRTNRFFYIPDPVVSLESATENFDGFYSFPKDGKMFLQCGMMSRRKMTLKILETIDTLSNDEMLFFLFTGKIQNDIREEFYRKYEAIRGLHNIYVKDCHLSYEEMSYFLSTCDFVFILYDNVAQSSGFLGHAALHRKPVVAYKDGLIGKLVRKYHLGYTINDDSPVSLSQFIQRISNSIYSVPDKYIKTHQVQEFTKCFFES